MCSSRHTQIHRGTTRNLAASGVQAAPGLWATGPDLTDISFLGRGRDRSPSSPLLCSSPGGGPGASPQTDRRREKWPKSKASCRAHSQFPPGLACPALPQPTRLRTRARVCLYPALRSHPPTSPHLHLKNPPLPSSPSRKSVLEPHNCLNKNTRAGGPQAQAEVALHRRCQERRSRQGAPRLISAQEAASPPRACPSLPRREARLRKHLDQAPFPVISCLGSHTGPFWPTQMETEGVQGWALPTSPPSPTGALGSRHPCS